MLKKPPFWDRIKITLAIALIYIFLLPLVPFLRQEAVWATTLLVTALGVAAYARRARIDSVIAGILALGLIGARLIFKEVDAYTLLYRFCGIMSFLFLNFTLFIGPWSRYTNWFLHFYKHRRHFGVTTFLLGLMHGTLIFFQPYFGSLSIVAAWQQVFVFFGFTALFIMSLLAITSWDYVQKHISLGWWKMIHFGLFLIYAGIVAYFYKISGGIVTGWQKLVLGFFLAFLLLVAPYSLAQKILYKVNGWKQLHVLIYIAYIATIVHVADGMLLFQPLWLKILFWMMVGVVTLSHVVGWGFMLGDFTRRKKFKSVFMEIDSEKYYLLDKLENFIEGAGRRFDIEGVPVAVFKNESRLFALSNICGHQGGPLYQGKIRNGYVECPWHSWQFSVKDGCGPPGYIDCVPYYPVIEKNGMAYISLKAILKP